MSGKCNVELGKWPPKGIVFSVKVQLSLYDSRSQQQILVYNEDQSIMMQGPPGADIIAVMDGRQKVFFEATLTNGLIEIGKEIPDPGW